MKGIFSSTGALSKARNFTVSEEMWGTAYGGLSPSSPLSLSKAKGVNGTNGPQWFTGRERWGVTPPQHNDSRWPEGLFFLLNGGVLHHIYPWSWLEITSVFSMAVRALMRNSLAVEKPNSRCNNVKMVCPNFINYIDLWPIHWLMMIFIIL